MANTKFTAQNFDPNNTTGLTPVTWNPTETGFSGAGPTVNAQYAQIGKIGFIWYDTTPGSGTSNATTFTITNLPLSPAITLWIPIIFLDNDNRGTAPGSLKIDAGATTATLYTNIAGTGTWTAANGKAAWFYVYFPIA